MKILPPRGSLRLILPCLLLSKVFFTTPCFAQENKPPQGRQVRFLPVGEAPPFRQEVRDGVRYELEPPPGSIPPREILVGFSDKEQSPPSAPLSLGRITRPLKAPAGAGPLIVRRQNDGQDAEPWLNITRPESGDFLVLLWRDPTLKTWGKARSLVLQDDPIAMPAGTWRIINLSPATVGVTLAGEKLILEPERSFRRILPFGKESICEVFLQDTSGNPKRLYSAGILHNTGERGLIVIYLADGEDPRRPVKVSIQREPVPAPPPDPSKGKS